jgi:hypothetical protein
MIDNYKIIKPLLDFSDNSKFYFLQIIQRRKENPGIPANNRVIKNYFINNLEYLERKWDEIKGLCEFFNARAMLRLNRRSYETIAYKNLQKLAEIMEQKFFKEVKSAFAKVCGTCHAEKEKTWIVDIDEKLDNEGFLILQADINRCQPEGDKIKLIVPSLNGFHLITSPFNVKQFRDESTEFGSVDIQKDNPTNLYIK